ncbi:MAG: DUF4173 domain-containing protein [Faecalibacterium sp.]|jgi:hypothetical protein|nr:DUF4173 domain-containing protein [Faecalibacterium sp.]
MQENERQQGSTPAQATQNTPLNALPNTQAAQPSGAPMYTAAPAQPPQPLNPWLSGWAQAGSVLASYVVARLYVGIPFDEFLLGLRGSWLMQWRPLIFTLLFLAWGETVFCLRARSGGPKASSAVLRESAFWAACTVALSVAISLFLGDAAGLWCGIFWHGFAAYWVLCRSGCLTENATGPFFALDALYAIVIMPFANFFLRIRTLARGLRLLFTRRRAVNTKTLWATLLCLAVAVPFFFCAVNLLMQADSGFAALLEGFRLDWRFSTRIENELAIFAFSLPVGAYLYGLIGGCARREKGNAAGQALRRQGEQMRCIPKTADTLILTAFCILYLLFFIVQAGYLFGAFAGKLPEGFTVAEYARQGFYQLCWILVMNFGLLTVCARLSAVPVRAAKAVRGLCLALMGASLLFSATAFSKIFLYIKYFSFTPRRLLSSWAVIVFAAGSILAIVTLLKPNRAIQKFVWFAAASFTVLCFWPC